MIKNLIAAITGSFYGYIAALVIGAAIGGGGVYWVQELRLDAVVARAELAERDIENARDDTKQCTDALEKQNEAVATIKLRAALAEAAMKNAEAQRTVAETKASDILRERTPANADKCVAARDAFAAELKRERGQ